MSKGDSYVQEAEKALKRITLFGFGKSQKYEDAKELYIKAGNSYKLSNQWQSAGTSFLEASKCSKEADPTSNIDSVNHLIEAGNCFKKISPSDAISAYLQAIEIYNENGRFSQSAKYYKEIAEIYEAEGQYDEAINYYNQSSQLLINDNKKQNARDCLLKVATLQSNKDNFIESSNIFESVAKEAMESRLGSYSAKGYLFQSLLCLLAAGDSVAVNQKLDAYKDIDYSFGSSRECGFIEKLVTAIEAMDSESFATACAEFDRISPLDPWKTSVLLKAKRHISTEGGDDEVDLA